MENTQNQNNKSHSYFLTIFDINDFLNEDDTVNNEKIYDIAVDRLGAIYYCFNLEYTPTTGRKHLHLVICFLRPVEFSRVHQLFNRPNTQTRKGTIDQCINYLVKCGEHTFREWGIRPPEQKSYSSHNYSLAFEELKTEVRELRNEIKELLQIISSTQQRSD